MFPRGSATASSEDEVAHSALAHFWTNVQEAAATPSAAIPVVAVHDSVAYFENSTFLKISIITSYKSPARLVSGKLMFHQFLL